VHEDSALDIKDWQFYLRRRNWLLFGKNYRCILKNGKKSNELVINKHKTAQLPWRGLCMLLQT
jgi:hypothetical protein